eukprot:COSAG01_NODE_1529_length_10001_cov_2.242583_10_plen_42_part_00
MASCCRQQAAASSVTGSTMRDAVLAAGSDSTQIERMLTAEM